jgi:hypothetical protein
MADTRHEIAEGSSVAAACPEFEDLSRFVDGEVEGTRHAEISAHVSHCAWCAGLTKMIRVWYDSAAETAGATAADHSCSTTEMLVGYLTTGLSDTERDRIDGHVRDCDQCIHALTVLQRRLLGAEEIATPVPASVMERAQAAATPRTRPVAPAAGLAEVWSALSSVGRRLSAHIRVPALVPAAVAAGALLVVAGEHGWRQPEQPQELTRAVPMRQSLRVTAQEALVYAQPSARTATVGSVSRGAVLEVAGLEKDWYRVVLPDGQEGWVTRGAFE